MNRWRNCPSVLRHRVLITLLTGTGSLLCSIVFSVLYHDRFLFVLGSILFAGCLLQGLSLRSAVLAERYETVSGTYINADSSGLHKYKKVTLRDNNHAEITLLLNRRIKLTTGFSYRFYFQKGGGSLFGNEHLDMALSAGSFLGYERI